MLDGAPLVEVRRGARVESCHRVAACVVDAGGEVLLEMGAIDIPVYLRSAAKPFISAAVVRSGAVDAFGFDERELALMTGSHAGEPGHVETTRSMLRKASISESALRCGGHPDPVANNCSGKHAGILALAKHLGAPLDSYLEPEHPAQVEILALCSRLVGEPLGPGRIAVDGCGIPVFATSLRRAARAFMRLATLSELDAPDREALERVRAAVLAHPWYIAGTERFDTTLVEATQGAILGKGGAEGYHGCALIAQRAALALKIIDGSHRAVAPAVIGILDRLGSLDEGARHRLQTFAEPPVRSVAGRIVGSISAAESLPETH